MADCPGRSGELIGDKNGLKLDSSERNHNVFSSDCLFYFQIIMNQCLWDLFRNPFELLRILNEMNKFYQKRARLIFTVREKCYSKGTTFILQGISE